MVAVILATHGLPATNLESLLKAAGWAPRLLSTLVSNGGLDAELQGILGGSEEGDIVLHTAVIATLDLLEADRAVEQIRALCRRVRILLVAPDSITRESRRAIVRSLRAGADDFVTASAVASELTLRLSTGRGRTRRRETGRLQRICGLQLERGTRRLRQGERSVSLTPCEYRVFACLARRPSHVVSRSTIQKHLARRSRSASKNMVDVYVLYLRRKLGMLECGCSIRTIRGVGYALAEERVMAEPPYASSNMLVTTAHLEA